MRIAQIVPGVGDTSTCVNCLRDAALLKAFIKQGHEVLVVPLYLPFRPDGERPAAGTPIFFGAINVYLQQKSIIFRKTPRCIDRIFDCRRLLEWVSGKTRMVDAKLLGSTTVSMLKGQDGYQVKEVGRLVRWFEKKENRPDVVCLSNALLAGIAGGLKRAIGAPIVCLLQGEDKFLDDLTLPYSQQAWEILGECAAEIDAFISVGRDYADAMKERLNIEEDKMHFVCADVLDGKAGAVIMDKAGVEKIAGEIASVFAMILKNFNEGDYA